MGQQCSGEVQACCGFMKDSEYVMPGYTPNSKIGNYQQFRSDDLARIVKIQAHIRGFLAKRRLMRILQNPEKYLRPD